MQVAVGDQLWVASSAFHDARNSAFVVATVQAVRRTVAQGLYNPYTIGGSIVVDSVLASCHSDWFADATFDRLGITHLLPSFYQVHELLSLLSPAHQFTVSAVKNAIPAAIVSMTTIHNTIVNPDSGCAE